MKVKTIPTAFRSNRILAIERDGGKCVGCGMNTRESVARYGKGLTVDHINGHGTYDLKSDAPNHDLSNLQTLCFGCHGLKSSPRKDISAVEVPLRERTCNDCQQTKLYPANFPIAHTTSGVIYRRGICNDCRRVKYRELSKK